MSDTNTCIFTGHLGTDPEIRYTANGVTVANFRIANSQDIKSKSGEKTEVTHWIPMVAWGVLAENVGKYLQKGSGVYIESSLQIRKWEKDGETRYSTEFTASKIKFLTKIKESAGNTAGNYKEDARGNYKKENRNHKESAGNYKQDEVFEDDIPF